jgi:hypothetical protein
MASISFKSAEVAVQLLDCRLCKYKWYVRTDIAESNDCCVLRVSIRVDDSASKAQVLRSLGNGWLGFDVEVNDVTGAAAGDARNSGAVGALS